MTKHVTTLEEESKLFTVTLGTDTRPFQINLFSTPSSNPSIKVYDDPSYVDDTYTNVNNGNFTANWQWWGCCTDGLVLELIRSSSTNNFCVAVNLTRYEGISQVVVSSENDYGSSDIVKLDNDRVRLCGTTCNNTCGTYSNCQSCTNDPKCGWCVETETCELGTSGMIYVVIYLMCDRRT